MNKTELREKLSKRDGFKCHYCEIDEDKFLEIWGDFYGNKRGKTLEIDRKDSKKGYSLENCVLACAICNCSKSDKFTYEEFKKVGKVIKQIWPVHKSLLSK